MAITIKNAEELEGMRAACQAAASVLQYLEDHVRPGVTTGELDGLAREYVLGPLGCTSATIGYTAGGSRPPFPGAICASVNHVVCHGIPGNKKLKRGDIMNIDVTVIKDGWHGDTSKMYYVGEPSVLGRRLSETAHAAMVAGIEQVRPGATLGDIGHAIQQVAEAEGFSIVREYCVSFPIPFDIVSTGDSTHVDPIYGSKIHRLADVESMRKAAVIGSRKRHHEIAWFLYQLDNLNVVFN